MFVTVVQTHQQRQSESVSLWLLSTMLVPYPGVQHGYSFSNEFTYQHNNLKMSMNWRISYMLRIPDREHLVLQWKQNI